MTEKIISPEIEAKRYISAFGINFKGKLFVPTRTKEKKLFSSCLDFSVGGKVEEGESFFQTFIRESLEELRFDPTSKGFRTIGVLPHMKMYEFYLPETPAYNPLDFVSHEWLSPQELAERIRQGAPAKSDLLPILKRFYL